MPKAVATFLAASAAMLAGCTTMADVPTSRVGQATLSFANGLPAGTAQLLRDGSGLRIVLAATGMTPGSHGFHLHTTGKCEGPKFESAGAHWNPNKDVPRSWYFPIPQGYIDYPTLEEEQTEAAE